MPDRIALPSDVFVNRELSWLEFNRRVLEEAQDPSVPLMERVKFLAIFSSNLDEFFMVRVAELKRRIRAGDPTTGPDGLSPTETMAAVSGKVHELVEAQHRCFLEDVGPILASEGIRLVRPKEVTPEQERFLDGYFQRTLMPVLTPLAIDPGHPFPHLANRSLCLVVAVRASSASVLPHTTLTVVHIPSQVVPRFVPLPGPPGQHAFILLEDVIRLQLPALYAGYEVLSCHAIRVTRDADLALERTRAVDLLTSVEAGVRERRMGDAVRLQYDPELPVDLLATLVDELELAPDDLYGGTGFTAFSDLFQLYTAVDVPRLKDQPMPPRPVPAFDGSSDVWSAIRSGDVLVHHPYHSFDAVTRFVSEAAVDPRVLAIKMTLYRVSPTSPIAHALALAAENGKEVAVLVELQARFDEEANIRWARALEEVGAHVVYGLLGYKTHCKACLVVRQEPDGIRRYCHLATGNYNARTGGIYADLGLFTCREAFGEDVTELFNLLTGYTRPRRFKHLLVAPTGLREGFRDRIRREAEHARRGPTGAHRRQDEQPGGSHAHRGALPREPGRRHHRPDRARDLLPASGHPGPVGSHPRHLDRRPLPRARPGLLLPERRGAGVLARLGRLDASQPRSPRRDRLPGVGPPPAGPDPRGSRPAAERYGEGARDPARRQLGPRSRRRFPPVRSQERLYALGAVDDRP